MPRIYIIHHDLSVPVDPIEVDNTLYYDKQWQLVQEQIAKHVDGHWEHVNVLFEGRHCHMFVDEVGILKGLPINPKATVIYYNNVNKRKGRPTYDDLSVWQPPYDVNIAQPIAGPAILWTGELQ